VRRALVAEVASCIVVVEHEAESESLVRIDGEFGLQAILTVLLVAAVVVVHVGQWREGIGEQVLFRLPEEETIGVCEHKRAHLLAVNEDTAQAGCIVVAGRVVFTIEACVERCVRIEVGQGVGYGWDDVAELPVDSPRLQSLGYLLVVVGGIVVVLVEVLVTLRDVAALVYLVVYVLGRCSE